MPEEELQLPIEIPWKLGSTTQPLETGGPKETTISLFFHEPKDESLVSVSPCLNRQMMTQQN